MKLEKNDLSGFFSKCSVQDGRIKKQISFHSIDEYNLYVNVLKCDIEKVFDYYRKLSKARVDMPQMIRCTYENGFCSICQEYIDGISLSNWICSNDIYKTLDKHLAFFKSLLDNQKQIFIVDNKLRIDFNLRNFIVKNDVLYLVDIMPPIFIDEEVKERSKQFNNKIFRLIELYSNINYQIVSMIGYWFLDCLNNLSRIAEPLRRVVIDNILSVFIKESNKYLASYNMECRCIEKAFIYQNADNYFFRRVFLLYEYIDENIQFEKLVYLFNIRMHSD